MNAQADTFASRAAAWRAQAGELWRARSQRDRTAIVVMAGVLGAFLLWTLGIAPAWRTLQTAPTQIEALEAQLLQMRTMAAEVRELRNTTPIPAAQAGVAMKAAAERHGDKVRLTLQAERALITFTNASPEQVRALLVEARSAARARPLEAQLSRGANGFNGTLVLSLGAN